jgi:hypothetical protein
MQVEPWKFVGWHAKTSAERADTINTLIHEMTHLVPMSATNRGSYLQDGGQWTWWCDTARLASYAIGDEGEKIWLSSQTR